MIYLSKPLLLALEFISDVAVPSCSSSASSAGVSLIYIKGTRLFKMRIVTTDDVPDFPSVSLFTSKVKLVGRIFIQ